MPIYRAKITYIFTGTIDIEAVDEIDAEDKIGRLNVMLDLNHHKIVDSTFRNTFPTNERILVINKIKD
jgi:hypothetical protein